MPSRQLAVQRKGGDHPVDVDVDAILAANGHTPVEVTDSFTMGIFGESFRVLRSVNILALILTDEDDPRETAYSVRTVINMVHPDDRPRFRSAIASNAALSGEAINDLVGAMIQGASAPNPSSSQRASGRTAKRTTSRVLSAEN